MCVLCTVNIVIIINLHLIHWEYTITNYSGRVIIILHPKIFMVSVISQSKLNMIGGYLATTYEKIVVGCIFSPYLAVSSTSCNNSCYSASTVSLTVWAEKLTTV